MQAANVNTNEKGDLRLPAIGFVSLFDSMAFHKQAELLPKYQLPSWTRTSLAGRQENAATRLLPRDKLGTPRATSRVMLERAVSLREGNPLRNTDSAQSRERITQLERNLAFLRAQHSDTLRQLHTELERLKKENRGNKCSTVSDCAIIE